MMDIEKLAREAGFQCLDLKIGPGYDPIKLIQPVSSTNIAVELSRLIALVLDEAAKECDIHAMNEQNLAACGVAMRCAASVRALTRQPTTPTQEHNNG